LSIGSTHHSDTGYYGPSILGFKTGEDFIAAMSNRDDDLTTLFAPGDSIPAATLDNTVGTKSGTSMASPIVAGAVVVIQQIAESLFGQRLTFEEMVKLFQTYGDVILDGDDEDDGLYHSGDSYSRLDILEVAKALISLAGPGQYSTELSSGNDATNLDFGVTELGVSAPGESGILVGTYFSDRMPGSSSSDKMYGGPGNDEIYGMEGADVIYGGDGNDIIEGGAGIDTLTGGKGRDTFKFLSLTDLGDTITDFTGGAEGDVIAVKTLLSALGYDSDDPFVDGWLKLEQVGADTLIKLDKDGGGDNFDTLVVTLQSFTLADFKRENIDPESSIWKASGAQATSLPSMTIDSGSLDIDLSNISNQSPSGINISLEDLNLEDLPILEESNKIELNLEEDLSDIILEVKDSDPVTESLDNEIGYVLNAVYEEDELLFVGLEI
jgi:Ca2+-binding RTX toxin-like protein